MRTARLPLTTAGVANEFRQDECSAMNDSGYLAANVITPSNLQTCETDCSEDMSNNDIGSGKRKSLWTTVRKFIFRKRKSLKSPESEPPRRRQIQSGSRVSRERSSIIVSAARSAPTSPIRHTANRPPRPPRKSASQCSQTQSTPERSAKWASGVRSSTSLQDDRAILLGRLGLFTGGYTVVKATPAGDCAASPRPRSPSPQVKNGRDTLPSMIRRLSNTLTSTTTDNQPSPSPQINKSAAMSLGREAQGASLVGMTDRLESVKNSSKATKVGFNVPSTNSATKTPIRKPRYKSISTKQLYNIMMDGSPDPMLFDPSYLVIVDSRSSADYAKGHIVTAQHWSKVTDSHYRVEATPSSPGQQRSCQTRLIVYGWTSDACEHEAQLNINMLTLKLKMAHIDLVPCVLSGGYNGVRSRFPFLCTKEITGQSFIERKKCLRIYPSIILDRGLYLGRGNHTADRNIISDLGITHVVNISMEHPNRWPADVEYLTMRLRDDKDANILERFNAVYEFILAAWENSSKAAVLIHCNMGISRSAAFTLAFLMRFKHWTLVESWQFLRECRSVVRPNKNFVNQLSDYEMSLFGSRLSDASTILTS